MSGGVLLGTARLPQRPYPSVVERPKPTLPCPVSREPALPVVESVAACLLLPPCSTAARALLQGQAQQRRETGMGDLAGTWGQAAAAWATPGKVVCSTQRGSAAAGSHACQAESRSLGTFSGRSEGRGKGMGRRECRAGAGLGPGLGPRMDRGGSMGGWCLGGAGADARIGVKKGRTVLGRVAACVELRVPV